MTTPPTGYLRRVVPLAVALTISGVFCVVAAYFCHYFYSLYRNSVTELESRIQTFDHRLGALEAHKARELTPVRVWGMISTTDRTPDDYLLRGAPARIVDGEYEITNAKGGPWIQPEIRLSAGSSTNYEFTIQIEKQFGIVADAWLSHAEPYQGLASFEQFRVYCPNGTNVVRLIARTKPDVSISMRFDIVVLCER